MPAADGGKTAYLPFTCCFHSSHQLSNNCQFVSCCQEKRSPPKWALFFIVLVKISILFNLLRGFIHCKKVSCRTLQHSLKQLKQTIFFLLPSTSPDGPTSSLTNATVPLQKTHCNGKCKGNDRLCRCLGTFFCLSSILFNKFSLNFIHYTLAELDSAWASAIWTDQQMKNVIH